jgi:hypothetical protein
MSADLVAVVTTIQGPTGCMEGLLDHLRPLAAPLLILGDAKGPFAYDAPGSELVTLDDQLGTGFALARLLPTGHYCRKNVGYLLAFQRGAQRIYETDDDNAPLASWSPRERTVQAREVEGRRWFNAYRAFTDANIWPRGLPLDRILDPATWEHDANAPLNEHDCPIQQGLADRSPDVDAIWRLVLDRDFTFEQRPSVVLPEGTWCPFNSQSTWWWPPAYPLMYLPSYCSFRMTDIWRSFIAQRCLWELGHRLAFHAPEVYQERNVHDLMRDFRDEVPGYEGNDALVQRLIDLELTAGVDAVGDNLLACYRALVDDGHFPAKELELVEAWLRDVADVG